ncbi:hypothetical protein H072_6281 [Dactylellina haptotyla CBS 200.50]|uniref:histone acetyltransferase n=1 Tax=Dactylellina haptotyla (strain CBS 200.50) TaxID=1284197 RepID=S8AA74_DACHA|nr:hypothetical protein H072_6281 [Dactylellina haptotyla CBS 200.50]
MTSSSQTSSTLAPSLLPSSQLSGHPEPSPLAALLASSLPSSSPRFTIHHLSHPPTRCSPLYSQPSGQKPQKTLLTSHFLAVSSPTSSVLVYAIEIHIYTTRSSTTLFVSKADSTGFFPRSSPPPPKGSISPVRAITTAFLQHLINETRRPGISTHLTLFARAQDQYLFPNSVRNKGKHVLSDIQLIRWWARVLDPFISSGTSSDDKENNTQPRAYLLVPGLDATDLRNVIPSKSWVHGHPYAHPEKPVRECIPHFEDDPKARFMDELEEAGWKGVRNMKEFWELMAFRQECSLGKSVGFLSVLFEGSLRKHDKKNKSNEGESQGGQGSTVPGSQGSQSKKRRSPDPESGSAAPKKRKVKLPVKGEDFHSASTYTIASLLRNPSMRDIISKRSSTLSSRSSSFAGGDSSDSAKGVRVMSKKDYDRLMTSLLDSDFEGMKCAKESSELWIKMAGGEDLPLKAEDDVIHEKDEKEDGVKVNLLTVRKKEADKSNSVDGVNVLVPRKQAKVEAPSAVVNVLQPRKKAPEPEKAPEPAVNVLQPRKKEKSKEEPEQPDGSKLGKTEVTVQGKE